MQNGSKWVYGQKTEYICQISHHLLAFHWKISYLIILLRLPRRTHTVRPGDLASTFSAEGDKAFIVYKADAVWTEPRSPDMDELDTGSGLSYQLGSAQDRTISKG